MCVEAGEAAEEGGVGGCLTDAQNSDGVTKYCVCRIGEHTALERGENDSNDIRSCCKNSTQKVRGWRGGALSAMALGRVLARRRLNVHVHSLPFIRKSFTRPEKWA